MRAPSISQRRWGSAAPAVLSLALFPRPLRRPASEAASPRPAPPASALPCPALLSFPRFRCAAARGPPRAAGRGPIAGQTPAGRPFHCFLLAPVPHNDTPDHRSAHRGCARRLPPPRARVPSPSRNKPSPSRPPGAPDAAGRVPADRSAALAPRLVRPLAMPIAAILRRRKRARSEGARWPLGRPAGRPLARVGPRADGGVESSLAGGGAGARQDAGGWQKAQRALRVAEVEVETPGGRGERGGG